MTKRELVLFGIIIVIVIGFGALLWQPVSKPIVQAQPSSLPQAVTPAPKPPAFTPPPPLPDPGGPLSIKNMSREDATKLYVQRFNADHLYDWKRPLNFYGKVVDENNQPVAEAKIHYEWNTVDAMGGTSQTDALSDGNGLFSLTGQRGKFLGVHVEKEGYYTDNGGQGDPAFEYANPSDAYWYEPDANNPVIFHLRKKGDGAILVSKSFNVHVDANHPQTRVSLMQGSIKPDGVLMIASDTSKYVTSAEAFPWTVTLSMAEGGLIETNEQFPFMAPTSGYNPTMTMDMTNLDRSVWRGQMTKTYYFYLPSTNTYGRMTVNASSSLPLGLSYVYNPSPGNRILEPASK
jgi:hypothetical protein